MIIRQLNQSQFEALSHFLLKKAHTEPFHASYTVTMTINEVEYAVKLQPERHNKIAVLQALRIHRQESSRSFELITKGSVLSSFFKILLYQTAG